MGADYNVDITREDAIQFIITKVSALSDEKLLEICQAVSGDELRYYSMVYRYRQNIDDNDAYLYRYIPGRG
jgi:hypothetical protein